MSCVVAGMDKEKLPPHYTGARVDFGIIRVWGKKKRRFHTHPGHKQASTGPHELEAQVGEGVRVDEHQSESSTPSHTGASTLPPSGGTSPVPK